MITFQYDADVLEQFPNTVGGVIRATNIRNRETPEQLREAYQTEQQMAVLRNEEVPFSKMPQIKAWRQTFRGFNVDPTKYRSAPESLLRRLMKEGDIPIINTLVDIGNLISIRYALPVAVFDTRALHGGITVHFADGSERYTPLFQNGFEHPEPGEVIFSDDNKLVVARRWCWRQSNQSAANLETENVIIVIEAQHDNGHDDVEVALNDMLHLLRVHIHGNFASKILDRDVAGF
ncbi:MAG: hypothetical protein D6737_09460 [Chloroflexi bacterium]|nr:MAG: hypothetical protein CUN54_02280 [Phototrophicales bacterium]RMF80030.1 MAG: hypothetical protein D6737_09460 [Chloroflexota bacterium]